MQNTRRRFLTARQLRACAKINRASWREAEGDAHIIADVRAQRPAEHQCLRSKRKKIQQRRHACFHTLDDPTPSRLKKRSVEPTEIAWPDLASDGDLMRA